MRTAMAALQGIVQAIQDTVPPGRPPGGPGGPPHDFSYTEAFFQLLQFVGYFLAIGAIGFRFGIVRQIRGMSDEAKKILRADNAALLGMLGVVFLGLSYLGTPYIDSIVNHRTFAASLPKNPAQFEFRMTMLALALGGFALVRAASSAGWTMAAIGILLAVLQPLYTGRFSGKVNAVHLFAASTTAWLHLKRISALWTTSYGIALVIKLALVLIVVSFGAWNWRRVRPSLGGEGSELTIRKSATMELAFAALVLVATSVLVSLPSPR